MEMTPGDEIAKAIRTRHVCTPMARATSFGVEETTSAAVDVMQQLHFDYAPVTSGAGVVGFVRAGDLVAVSDTNLNNTLQGITARDLVTGDTPLEALMGWLRDQPFLFVVEGREIIGLVTPSDLNKQPGRTYFYLLIAGWEMSLAELLRRSFESQYLALNLLPAARQEQIRKREAGLNAGDVAADTIAAMELVDLMTVVKRTPTLLAHFGGYSPTKWQKTVCAPVSSLRHNVMHTVRTLATDEPASINRLVGIDRLLHDLLVVSRSLLI